MLLPWQEVDEDRAFTKGSYGLKGHEVLPVYLLSLAYMSRVVLP